jgi:DNA-directed RNA polymerase beta subunit
MSKLQDTKGLMKNKKDASKNKKGGSTALSNDSIFKLIDLYFKQKNIMYSHLYNSFDKFIDDDIRSLLKYGNNVFFEKVTKNKVYRYKFVYDNIAIKPPVLDAEDDMMFPSQARIRNLTYASKLVATITQVQEVIDIATDEVTTKVIGQPEHEYPIAILPIMVRSKYCSLNLKKNYDKSECGYDPGGYFIVNGSEKVVMSLERMIDNKPLVFIKKDSSVIIHNVQVNSRSHTGNDMTQIITVRMKKDNNMTIRVQILAEVPVFIVMRALGVETDKDIINHVAYDPNDSDMINLIRTSLDNTIDEKTKEKIVTQSEAIEYLLDKMKQFKRYNETDKEIRLQEKRMHLMSLLKDNFLPHVNGNLADKAFYLGYMINRLLQCYLGRTKIDDRDSYVNKRVDLPGNLLFDLFKQYYKKMLNECSKFFSKRNNDDVNPINIINQIKPNVIEQGLKGSLLTGAWGKKKGVAQMLQRLTYLQLLSSLRRVNSPTADASTNKLTGPRHLHSTQVGFVCVTGDTQVLCSDGVTVKKIKNMGNTSAVTTVSKHNLTKEPSRIKNYFSKMPDKLLKITTESGREIKCTPDHPLLVASKKHMYEMINSGDVKVGDSVIINHTQVYLKSKKELALIINSKNMPEKHRDILVSYNITDRRLTQAELKILVRLLGAFLSGGYIKEDECMLSLSNEVDVLDVIDDIIKLGFKAPYIERSIVYDSTANIQYVIRDDGPISYLLHHITRNIESNELPQWLINSGKIITREFLSGFVGSDKNSTMIEIHDNFNVNKSGGKIMSFCTTSSKLQETHNYAQIFSMMFNELGIKTYISHNCTDTSHTGGTSIMYDVCIHLYNNLDNLEKYVDNIEYRYNSLKRQRMALPVEYIKSKNYMFKNNSNDDDIVKNVDVKDLEEFKFSDFISENMTDTNTEMVSIKIAKIEELPKEKLELVYDFTTVSENHSFVANGIVVSNCHIETPEGSKVGLVKSLALMGSITVSMPSQIHILKNILNDRIYKLQDVTIDKIKDYTKVFLNGEWLGLTDKPRELYDELKTMKFGGDLDAFTGISHEIKSEIEAHELKINCDGGRMIRPVIRVKDNELLLNQKHIDMISLEEHNSATMMTSWNKFMISNPGIIEYIDCDEAFNAMIAMRENNINKMKKRMDDSLKLLDKVKIESNQTIVNRYDDFSYVKYTHCEIHPSMQLGVVVSNIPFCNHNQGPRNMYQYSQAKQAVGLYASNYRDRLDISYILYNPQRPIVTTRMMKYLNTDKLAGGENSVVAIACYTGFNQEDSVIMNQSAIDRGFMRSTSVKKYATTIGKNQSTSQDDVFIKPDPSKVTGMRHASYDKLSDKGNVPEETTVVNGDVIIGKVSPIQPTGNSNKTFKDSSEIYKSYIPGVVDKVYADIYNNEGYEMRKMRIRSERVPHIGDKFCCFDDSHEVLCIDGWKNIKDIKNGDIVASLTNNIMEYKSVKAIQKYDYNGKMYTIESNQISFKVTPNHRMYVNTNYRNDKNDFKIIKAEDIYGKRVRYTKIADDYKPYIPKETPKELEFKDNKVINYLVYDKNGNIEHRFNINDWLVILGIWLAEGSASSDRTLNFAINKDRVREALEKACKKLDIKLGKYQDKKSDKRKNRYSINSKVITQSFEDIRNIAINKHMPNWVKHLENMHI